MDVSTRSMQANRNIESWVIAIIALVVLVIGLIPPVAAVVAIVVLVAAGSFLIWRLVLEPVYADWLFEHEINRPLTEDEKTMVDECLMSTGQEPIYNGRP